MLGVLRSSGQSCTKKELSCVTCDFQMPCWTVITGKTPVCNHCNLIQWFRAWFSFRLNTNTWYKVFCIQRIFQEHNYNMWRENYTLFCSNIHHSGNSSPMQQGSRKSKQPDFHVQGPYPCWLCPSEQPSNSFIVPSAWVMSQHLCIEILVI